jgi:hypothetical protein
MSAPTLDTPPTNHPATGRPRRRTPLVLVTSALLVVAVAVGVSLAIATRPVADRAPAPAAQPAVTAQQPAGQDQAAATQPPAAPQAGKDRATGSAATPVLPDGEHDAYITEVDQAHRRIVVDVVQVFTGQAARDAAIADGVARDKAQYLGVYLRNQNPRLRTLPLASDLRLDLRGGCESPTSEQLALLAADARAKSGSVRTFYFHLTVKDGKVHRIDERLAINAC